MKIISLLLLCVLPFVFTGCATTGSSSMTPEQITKFIQDNRSTIEAAINSMRRLAIQLSIKDPAKAKELNLKISGMAAQLESLLTQKDFDPQKVKELLVIKEDWIAELMCMLPIAWDVVNKQIDKMSGDSADKIQLARLCAEVLASGLAGTPGYIATSLKNAS